MSLDKARRAISAAEFGLVAFHLLQISEIRFVLPLEREIWMNATDAVLEALTVEERLHIWRNGPGETRNMASEIPADFSAACRHLKLPEDVVVRQLCEEQSCSREDLFAAMSSRFIGPAEFKSYGSWTIVVQEIVELATSGTITADPRDLRPGAFGLAIGAGLWVAWARLQLLKKLNTSSVALNTAWMTEAVLHAARNLSDRLYSLLERTLVLEMNIHRLRRQEQEQSSSIRYEQFCTQLASPGYLLAFAQAYPALARRAATVAEDWISTTYELVTRLWADRDELHDAFKIEAHDLIIGISYSGDSHCSGRQVAVVEFAKGKRVVYKPRDLSSEIAFAAVNDFFSHLSPDLRLRLPSYLVKEHYGWAEFIKHLPCLDELQLRSYYRNVGVLLGFCYLLGVKDVIGENLIAAEQHPIPIDLECLGNGAWPEEDLGSNLARNWSLLSTGLLPSDLLGTAGVDVSGIGSRGDGDLIPYAVPILYDAASDSATIKNASFAMTATENMPNHDGNYGSPSQHVESVVEGFERVLTLAQRHATSFEASSAFALLLGAKPRCLVRATLAYGRLLRASTHPVFAGKGLALDVLWTKIYQEHSWRNSLLPSERRQLWRYDIPLFRSLVVGSSLSACGEDLTAPNSVISGAARIRERLQPTAGELAPYHRWTIARSLGDFSRSASMRSAEKQLELSALSTLDLAILLAKLIASYSIQRKGSIAWLDLKRHQSASFDQPPSTKFALSAMDLGLYGGLSGIFVAFKRLATMTNEPWIATMCQQLGRTILPSTPAALGEWHDVSAFTGTASLLYSLPDIHDEEERPSTRELLTDRLLTNIANGIEKDTRLDFVTGIAGTMCTLITFATRTKNERSLRLAIRCAERLLSIKKKHAKGLAWEVGPGVCLTGFGHGAAGFAYAFCQLWKLTQSSAYLEVAAAAIDFENAFFEDQVARWKDLRPWMSSVNGSGTEGWCVGAPGIGLARAAMYETTKDKRYLTDVAIAIEKAANTEVLGNDCLCHGVSGNLAILSLLRAEGHTNFTTQTLRNLATARLCGSANAETPSESFSLMLGMSGILYALLDTLNPSTHSILTLS